MALDNAPSVRQKKQLERKQGRRASYDRILIVSEGSKTEPNYFREIRAAYRLHTANVEVQPSELGTAPIQVVQYAQELFENGDRHKSIQRCAFEQIYAVFDRDDHGSYDDALALADQLNGKLRNDARQSVTFQTITSVPNFELWLLLHFEDIQAPLRRDEVMRRLKRHIPDYVKGSDNTFTITREHLAVATQRAEQLAQRFSAHTDPEPFTAVVDLVKLLTTLRG
ncbi:MAG TPA: RloB family protein [Nitrosomonas europaea]|uniref:RloB family protein n=1 Tax=Nitrosomonas europaea TaxID=915 RepID=UPI002491B98E|nr:RloB family protein [Nitrosomonas europaea]HRN82651.1 RloB family protein [Nitrosomonas europaea]HRO57356.1 RloB family protein [Nitrosomonas europaea]HRQ09193.1 RloB family protein [Nitrosomonas europaea]HUM74952.1 RloB family protein [Nitrosomonas europaea]